MNRTHYIISFRFLSSNWLDEPLAVENSFHFNCLTLYSLSSQTPSSLRSSPNIRLPDPSPPLHMIFRVDGGLNTQCCRHLISSAIWEWGCCCWVRDGEYRAEHFTGIIHPCASLAGIGHWLLSPASPTQSQCQLRATQITFSINILECSFFYNEKKDYLINQDCRIGKYV